METVELEGHIVICNWTPIAGCLIEQLHAEVVAVRRPIVVVSPEIANGPQSDSPAYDQVYFIPGDPSSDRALQRAGVAGAYAAVILADPKLGEHADSRSILIALAIEAIEPRVHTCVELLHAANRYHFRHTHVDEVICVDELASKLIAQSCLTPGLSEIYLSLLTATADSNELYIVPAPERFAGRSYRDVALELAGPEGPEVVLLGLMVPDGDGPRRLALNPRGADRERRLAAGDGLVVMAYERPDL